MYADIDEVVCNLLGRPMISEMREPRFQWLVGTNQQQIAVPHQPDADLRKHRGKRGHDRPQIGVANVIGVRPLAEETPWPEPRLCRFEELAGEERGDPRHPRV